MKGTATFVRVVAGFPGDARLYTVDPALAFRLGREGYGGTTDHVLVAVIPGETAIFAADPDGHLLSWRPVLVRGRGYHGATLEAAGYAVGPVYSVPDKGRS